MNWPGAAARRRSIAASALSTSSVCSTITTASAPRGTTPPVAMVVAVPRSTPDAGAWPHTTTSALRRSRFGDASLAPTVSAARNAKPSTLERSNGGTSIGAVTSCASTRPSDARERDALRRQRRKIDMARKPRARLFGGDDFEELLLPRGAADHLDEVVTCGTLVQAIAHGHGLIMTSLPAGKPSLLAGTRIQPSVPASGAKRPIARGYGLRLAARADAPGRSPPARSATRPCAPALRPMAGSPASLLPDSRSISGSPIVSHPAMAASIRPGSSSTGRLPLMPNAAVSPGEIAMPCATTRPLRASVCTLASLRPLPVPPMAMTASAAVSASAAARSPALRRVGAAARVQRARQQIADGVEHDVGIGARLHQADPRLAHQHLLLAGHRQHGEIEIVEPPSGAGDEIAGAQIGAAREHAVAGGRRRNRLEAAAAARRWHRAGRRHPCPAAARRRRRREPAQPPAAPAHRARRRRSPRREPRSRRCSARASAGWPAAAATSSASAR